MIEKPVKAGASPWALRAIWMSTAIAIAALEAVVTRDDMNPDGISYLEIARAYLAGDLQTAVNAY